jgi:hypothetical protein
MVRFRMARNSGGRTSLPLESDISKVIGGALKPLPTLIFHSCKSLTSSQAANDLIGAARELFRRHAAVIGGVSEIALRGADIVHLLRMGTKRPAARRRR